MLGSDMYNVQIKIEADHKTDQNSRTNTTLSYGSDHDDMVALLQQSSTSYPKD
ncbi:MAG: hypothetical protein L3J98_16730 [Gammaproteobacteria bacterium]|nr:hypothetical protein [Gammaproteobacteria bacterium]MCF6261776.1 hypothetical protein [Gammaproteobacteria bacterium]